jgi:hypothetical protein
VTKESRPEGRPPTTTSPRQDDTLSLALDLFSEAHQDHHAGGGAHALDRVLCVVCMKETASTEGPPLHSWCSSSYWRLSSREEDPATSALAAKANRVHKARLRQLVLQAHQAAANGLTDDELHVIYPDQDQRSLAKRRGELSAEGVIVDIGLRRRTRRGSSAIVWQVTR